MTLWERLCESKFEIIEKYLSGIGTPDLGKMYGVSGAYIYQLLVKNEVPIRGKHLTKEREDQILKLHQEGKSAYAIGMEMGMLNGVAGRAIKAAGNTISHRQKKNADPVKNHKDEIIALYESGLGVEAIAPKFNTFGPSILKLLKKNGIRIRSLREYAHPVNEHFFSKIDNEYSSYCLGFWMADGSNDSDRGVTRIAITDPDILRDMAAAMDFKGPIHERMPRKPTHKTQYQINIGSRVMSDDLVRVGCMKNKTYLAKFPRLDQVPAEQLPHLIRGWTDGDGTITKDSRTKSWHWRIVGTEDVCVGMAEAIETHFGIKCSAYPIFRGNTHITWGATITGREKLKAFFEVLYKDASIYLARKRAKYDEFINDYNEAIFKMELKEEARSRSASESSVAI